MTSKLTHHSLLAATVGSFVIAGALILAPAASQAGYPASPISLGGGPWKIDIAKSHFGPEKNTMVIERATSSSADANAGSTFVVIAAGKVYLATAPEAYDAQGVKKIEYGHWKDMKLLQVGENAKSIDLCGFLCQSGHVEDHLTLTFRSVNGGMSEMGNLVVYNQR